jgi:glycosyltransferase involved in cell wall biosynthesis
MRLFVTICTRERPDKLLRCLSSLARDACPDAVALWIVVIENEPAPSLGPRLARLAAEARLSLIHVHEPRIGISFARNRGVDEALARGADWIAFLDDDEEVVPGWLHAMYDAVARDDADVLVGEVIARIPEPRPRWLAPPHPAKHVDGALLVNAASNNTLARARLFRSQGGGFRFDEALGLTGGEDVALFGRINASGAAIRWTASAKVEEPWPPVRLTLRWQLRRVYSTTVNLIRVDRRDMGVARVLAKWGAKAVVDALRGMGMVILGALAWPVAGGFGERSMFKGAKKLAGAVGLAAGTIGLCVERYRKVDE